jgi:hypothetical protein
MNLTGQSQKVTPGEFLSGAYEGVEVWIFHTVG